MARPRPTLWIQRLIQTRSTRQSTRLVTCRQFLRKRAIHRRVVWAVAVIGAALFARADYQGWLSQSGGDWWRYNEAVMTVLQVVDGESLILSCNQKSGATATVRLCGIDASQDREWTRHSDHGSVNAVTNAFLRRLVGGEEVRLRLAKPRDREGRLIAYVYLSDGTMLNEQLLAEGLAMTQRHEAHRWHERFNLIQLQAKRDAVGVWASGC